MAASLKSPLCPSCGKSFKNETTLLQHLNQPSGRCAAQQDDFVTLATQAHSSARSSSLIDNNNSTNPALLVDEAVFNGEGVSKSGNIDEDFLHRDFFPRAGQTYGDGQTFMDLFNTDCYTGQRANNVYYPFCTKGDWEMGSWLLQSGLSMCAINDFLKLEKVQVLFVLDEYTSNI